MEFEEAQTQALEALARAAGADSALVASAFALSVGASRRCVKIASWNEAGEEPREDDSSPKSPRGWTPSRRAGGLAGGLGLLAFRHAVSMLSPISKRRLLGLPGFGLTKIHQDLGDAELSILQAVASLFGGFYERRRYEMELEISVEEARRLAVEAEAANNAKGEFLANMSHEITHSDQRRPRHGEPPSRDGLDAGATPFRLDRQKQRRVAFELVGDVLDFSKIEPGS
jgi:signal transduction histidine kinase